MNIYIYIDYENMSNLRSLPSENGVKYFVFLGAKQKDGLKIRPGAKVRKIRCKAKAKDYLDNKIKEYITNRKQVQGVAHFILSKDKGFESFVNYMKMEHEIIIERSEDLDKIRLD